jgi:hypothetical protein
MQANEELYLRETVTDEEKERINGPNIRYKAVSYGLYGKMCNYIVMEINVPNIENRFTYCFMNIFEIIKQYHITVSYNDDNDNNNNDDEEELDSRLEDMENGIPRKRKKNSETESYNSYNSIESTKEFYSEIDDDN